MINKISKNINAYQLFQLLRYASMIVPTIFLSKYFYSQEHIGIYESFLIFASVFSFFWLSALFSTVLSNSKSHESKEKNIKNAFIAIHLINVMIIAILVISNLFLHYINDKEIICLVLYIFTNNPSFILEHKFLLYTQNKNLVTYGILFFIIQSFLAAFIVLLHLDIYYLIYLVILFASIRYLVSLFMIYKIKSKFERTEIIYLLKKSSPLLFSFFIAGIAEYIDAFIIKYSFGNSVLTIYRYGTREIPFVILLANALSVSMIPILSSNLNEGLCELKKRSTFLMHLSFMGTILLVLTCKIWYPLIFNSSFINAVPFFYVSSLLVISRCIFPQTILQSMQEIKALMFFSLLELIINIFLSILLLNIYGAIGVVYGTLIAFSIDKIIQTIYVVYYKKINLASFVNFKVYIVYSLTLVLSVVLSAKFIK